MFFPPPLNCFGWCNSSSSSVHIVNTITCIFLCILKVPSPSNITNVIKEINFA